MLLNGFGWYCDCCGVCADQDCIKKCDKKLACKTNEIMTDKMEHHWIKGNLPLGATCNVCDEDCSMDHGLTDFQCCWCHRYVHTSCLLRETKVRTLKARVSNCRPVYSPAFSVLKNFSLLVL